MNTKLVGFRLLRGGMALTLARFMYVKGTYS